MKYGARGGTKKALPSSRGVGFSPSADILRLQQYHAVPMPMYTVIYQCNDEAVADFHIRAQNPVEARQKVDALLQNNPKHDFRSQYPNLTVRVQQTPLDVPSNKTPKSTEYERRLALQPIRPLHQWERIALLELAYVADLSTKFTTPAALDAYRVREMLDDGMGSIRFVVDGNDRGFGRFNAAKRSYHDVDGTLVIFTLDLDDHGGPWEIDAWKVDYSPLKRPPSSAAELVPTVELQLPKRH